MKAKYFLIGFILLTLGAFCATNNTRAADYELGVSESEEQIWEITIVDEEGLEDLFQPIDLEDGGLSWRENAKEAAFLQTARDGNKDEVGAKLKYRVDWINESDDYIIFDEEENEYIEIDVWTIFLDTWSWIDPDNDFNPEPGGEELDYPIYQDPDDINVKSYTTYGGIDDSGADNSFLPIFGWYIPTPVEDYLDEIDWQDEDWIPLLFSVDIAAGAEEDDIEWNWESDGNLVICENTFVYQDDGDWEYDEFSEKFTYDENTGWMSSYQILNEDDDIIYEWAFVSAIPGYELPILLGVTAACVIGLIYVIKKRTR